MLKVLVTGDREWSPVEQIKDDLKGLLTTRDVRAVDVLLIHGGARGVDEAADVAARSLGIHVAVVRALWDFYHRSAGPRRNGVMRALEPDVCFAYHQDLVESRGTLDMVRQMDRAGVVTYLWDGARTIWINPRLEDLDAALEEALGAR